MEELNNLLQSIDDQDLTPEEIEVLKQNAMNEFNSMEGIEFDEYTDDDLANIKNDFKTTRKVLTKNIDRVEKLTNMLVTNVATQPENIIMLQSLISVISEQNKQIKMIHEIHNKVLTNTGVSKKNNETKDGGKSKSKFPPGMTLK